MRKALLVALVLAIAVPALAQAPGGAGGGKPKAIPGLGGPESDLENEAAIRKL